MKIKKNFLLGLFVFFFLFLSLTPFLVESGGDPPHEVPGEGEEGNLMKLYNLILSFANWFFSFLIAIAVIGIVIAGIMFVFAGGDPSKATTAKNMVLYSLIGVLVGSLGWILVNWIKDLVVD